MERERRRVIHEGSDCPTNPPTATMPTGGRTMDYADYLEAFLSCRGHAESAPDGGFSLPGDKPHYARDKVVDYKHFRLDISLDLDAKRVAGTVAHTFSAINE